MQTANVQGQRVLKFIRGKGHQHNADRLRVQKELFGFQKVRITKAPDSAKIGSGWIEAFLFDLYTKLGLDDTEV